MFISKWSAIQTGVRRNGPRVSQVNIRLPTGELSDAIEVMRRIHNNQREVFFVFLLVNVLFILNNVLCQHAVLFFRLC
jgi:hypothetical protein